MRVRSVLHLQGYLLLFCAFFMLPSVPWAFYYSEKSWPQLLLSAGITAAAGFSLLRFTDLNEQLRLREGFAVVSFAWLLFSSFGALPYWLTGSIPNLTDALFETVSGFTTTGASILADIEALPHGVLFWRSMTHWIGGIGIVVMSLTILPMLGVGGMQLYKVEAAGPTADKLTPRIAETAKILCGVYIALTLFQTLLLLLGGMHLFDALCTSFGTVASGGFSPRNASIAHYQSSYIEWVVILFMLAAGTNFALHFRFATGHLRSYWQDREFHLFLGSILAATLCVLFGAWHLYDDKGQAVRESLFMVASLHTTTGFGLADYEGWTANAQFVLLLAMMIGGSAGSTAGGLKVIRVYLLFKHLASEFTRLLHPQALAPIRLRKQAVPANVVTEVLGFVGIYGVGLFAGTLLLTATGVDWVSSLSAVVSTLSGVGPGMNSLGPFDNYGWLEPAAKWVLMGCMLLGRLEFFSLLILLSPAYWRR